MFIEDENFLKLVKNLRYYLSIDAEPLTEKYIDPIDPSIGYPKIRIGDIEICCLHYKNCSEAIEAWERRKKRVNYDNIFVCANSWNLHQKKELIEEVCRLPYPTVCFTFGNLVSSSNCVEITGEEYRLDERGIIRPNITDIKNKSYKRNYEYYFDFVKWLNQGR